MKEGLPARAAAADGLRACAGSPMIQSPRPPRLRKLKALLASGRSTSGRSAYSARPIRRPYRYAALRSRRLQETMSRGSETRCRQASRPPGYPRAPRHKVLCLPAAWWSDQRHFETCYCLRLPVRPQGLPEKEAAFSRDPESLCRGPRRYSWPSAPVTRRIERVTRKPAHAGNAHESLSLGGLLREPETSRARSAGSRREEDEPAGFAHLQSDLVIVSALVGLQSTPHRPAQSSRPARSPLPAREANIGP